MLSPTVQAATNTTTQNGNQYYESSGITQTSGSDIRLSDPSPTSEAYAHYQFTGVSTNAASRMLYAYYKTEDGAATALGGTIACWRWDTSQWEIMENFLDRRTTYGWSSGASFAARHISSAGNVRLRVATKESTHLWISQIRIVWVVKPDFSISNVEPSVANVEYGAWFRVIGHCTANTNGAPAVAVGTTYYLSTDTKIGAGDYAVLSKSNYPPIASSWDDWERVDVTSNIAVGTYYVIGKIDVNGIYDEIQEANNTNVSTTQITISAAKPDLVVTNISIGTPTPIRVTSFNVTAHGRNNGPGSATQERIYVYLSTDSTITTGDAEIGNNTGLSLASGQSRALTIACTLPSSVTDGTYYIGAIIDPFNTIAETNESNNVKATGPVQITHPDPVPDLHVYAMDGYSETVEEGTSATIRVTMQNIGNGVASNFYVGWYLGQYQYGLDKRSLVKGPYTLGSNASLVVTLTNWFVAGDSQYGAETILLDCSNTVAETDEANNSSSHAITIMPAANPKPDLVIGRILMTPSMPEEGTTFSATVTISNQGTAAGSASLLNVWVDKAVVPGINDGSYSGSWVANSLAAGQSTTFTFNDLPAPPAGGPYTLRAFVDASDLVSESNEGNNQSTISYSVSTVSVYSAYMAVGENALLSKPIAFCGAKYQVVGLTKSSPSRFSDLISAASYMQDLVDPGDVSKGFNVSRMSIVDAYAPAFLVICQSNSTWSVCEDETIRAWIYHLATAEVQAYHRSRFAVHKGVYSAHAGDYQNELHFRDFEVVWFPTILLYEPSVFFDPVNQEEYRQAAFEQPLKRYLTHGQLNLLTGQLIPLTANADFVELTDTIASRVIDAGALVNFVSKNKLFNLPPVLVDAGKNIHDVTKAWNLYEDMKEILVLDVLKADQVRLLYHLRHNVGGVVLDGDFADGLDAFIQISGDSQSQLTHHILNFGYSYARDEVAKKAVETAAPYLIGQAIEIQLIAPQVVLCNGVAVGSGAAAGAALIAVKLGSDLAADPKSVYEKQIVSYYAAKNAQNWERIGIKLAERIDGASTVEDVDAESFLMVEIMEREIFGNLCQNLVAATEASLAGNLAAGWAAILAADQWSATKATAQNWKQSQQRWNDVVREMLGRTRHSAVVPAEQLAPVVTISSPSSANVFTTASDSVVLGGSSSDDVGVLRVEWQSSAGDLGVCQGTTTWTTSLISLQPGTNRVKVTAYDASGKGGTDSLSIVYAKLDLQPPSVSICYPSSSGSFDTSQATVDVIGIATDDLSVVGATWSNSRGGNGACSFVGSAVQASGVPLLPGANVITLHVFDASGKSGSDAITLEYVPPVAQDPVVRITYPTTSSVWMTSATNLDIAGEVRDDGTVQTVRWANSRGGEGACDGSATWSALAVPLVEGSNLIRVTATDSSGGTGTATLVVLCASNSPYGSVRCDILPISVANSNGAWRLGGGNWLASGETLYGLAAGVHTIECSAVSGWIAPSGFAVSVTAGRSTVVSALYSSVPPGSVRAILLPPEAVLAGARYQIDGSTWMVSGATNAGLVSGIHTAHFSTVAGWQTPASMSVLVFPATITLTTGVYSKINVAPSVLITNPMLRANYPLGANVPVSVIASDQDAGDAVTQVVFCVNSLPVATNRGPVLTLQWAAASGGVYSLSAKAWDSWGGIGQSPIIPIRIGFGPLDQDGDGISDADEKVAGTEPLNASDFFRFLAPAVSNAGQGILITWSSCSGRYYRVERATNLTRGFSDVIAMHLPATPPLNVVTDSFASAGAASYRVGIENLARRVDLDFNGDRIAEIAVFNMRSSNWFIREPAGSIWKGGAVTWGAGSAIPVPSDYDGDGTDDLALFDAPTGLWSIRASSGTEMFGSQVGWGWSETLPVAGDYDGDKRADLAVFNPNTAQWYIRQSSTLTMLQGGPVTWGRAGAIPCPGDYDGDGRCDLAAYTPSDGLWLIRLSSGGSTTQYWGWSDALPLPADYNGDGRTDIAVYAPSTAEWYIQMSDTSHSSLHIAWGWSDTLPAPADYDGDGIADITAFYPAAGRWYVRPSSVPDSTVELAWGWSDARPVSAQFWILRRLGYLF